MCQLGNAIVGLAEPPTGAVRNAESAGLRAPSDTQTEILLSRVPQIALLFQLPAQKAAGRAAALGPLGEAHGKHLELSDGAYLGASARNRRSVLIVPDAEGDPIE